MCYDVINWLKKIDVRYKITIISAFVIGVFSQGMGLFNKFSAHDDPMNYWVGATYTSGRWMLDILEVLERKFYGDGHYSLPVFNGFISILFIAVSACFIIKLLDINNKFLCMFVSGIMVCFPVITSIFGYMFTLHFYMLALLLGVTGAYFICTFKKWYFWILGVILVTLSVGIYQAFIPVTVSVILFYLINHVMKYDDVKLNIKKILFSISACISFMILYFGVNKLYLLLKDAALSDYKSIDTMGKLTFGEILFRIIDAYKEFFVPTSYENYYMYPGTVLYIYVCILTITIILCVVNYLRLFKKNKINAIIFMVLVTVIPLSVNFIFVMTGREEVHSLMVYSQLMPFIFFVWIVEHTLFDKKILTKTLSCVTVFFMIALILMYCRVDNKCYLQATYAQQEAISYCNTLVTQIKSAEGYKDELPVAFINAGKLNDLSLQPGYNTALGEIDYFPYNMNATQYLNDYSWLAFMRQWTGYTPRIVDESSFTELKEVKDMPSYPDDGSIMIINDTVVVKF